MRRSIVGTTKVWVTRWVSTRVSQVPASNLGSRTVWRPWWSAMRSPRVPPMWKIGADIMVTICGASGSIGLE